MPDRIIAAIIVAAGSGNRAGLDVPKQYAPLGGRPMLAHSYAALASHPDVRDIVAVIGKGQEEQARAALASVTDNPVLVFGGETRRASVLAGLEHCERMMSLTHVLVHDAARPSVPHIVIDRLVNALNTHDGAIPVLPVVDTLARGADGLMNGNIEREQLYRVQTPQAFRFATILAAHRSVSADTVATDDAGLVRACGAPVALCQGDAMLEKLTHPGDFASAEAKFLTRMVTRTGMGFDVHRLVPNRPLWLCGVEINHELGLSGHSDADVALHALVDAMLGALAEGDIGNHFPPSDPQWKGAPSHRFLAFARDRVAARGGAIAHVDITIICEAPKIGPHRETMRARLAELLAIPAGGVSVKATTTEGLGFAGRGEGIAAQAVATLLLPIL